MSSDDPITIWAIKLKNRGRGQQILVLCKLLLLVAVFFAAFAAIQVHLCHEDYPHKTALECIRG